MDKFEDIESGEKVIVIELCGDVWGIYSDLDKAIFAIKKRIEYIKKEDTEECSASDFVGRLNFYEYCINDCSCREWKGRFTYFRAPYEKLEGYINE